jgi:hypothetical protein
MLRKKILKVRMYIPKMPPIDRPMPNTNRSRFRERSLCNSQPTLARLIPKNKQKKGNTAITKIPINCKNEAIEKKKKLEKSAVRTGNKNLTHTAKTEVIARTF